MRIPALFIGASLALGTAPAAPVSPQIPVVSAFTYADLAELSDRASIVADVTVRNAQRLRGAEAEGTPAGTTRFLIEADVLSLIKGAQGLPGRISWLADLPDDAANRPPRIRRRDRLLLLANPVEGLPGQVRLAARQGQIAWDAATDARLRAILSEAAAPGAPPRVTGIGHAFYVPGAIPGESETQIFLTTEDGRPVSISVLRRPGEETRWAVALAEIVDDSAAAPRKDSFLWYRLACSLPPALPDGAIDDMDTTGQDGARADYRVVIDGLGPCERTIPRP
jgi:hypothetical protein